MKKTTLFLAFILTTSGHLYCGKGIDRYFAQKILDGDVKESFRARPVSEKANILKTLATEEQLLSLEARNILSAAEAAENNGPPSTSASSNSPAADAFATTMPLSNSHDPSADTTANTGSAESNGGAGNTDDGAQSQLSSPTPESPSDPDNSAANSEGRLPSGHNDGSNLTTNGTSGRHTEGDGALTENGTPT